jgi:FAD/FMN-containing dehydrogenase
MNDGSAILKPAVLDALRSRLRGTSLVRGDDGYDAARRVWNGAIDRYPSCIVGCADAEDVSHAMRIAADHGLRMTVRGGGHNVAGRSIRDGWLLLDLSKLRQVSVNRELQVATVQGGAVWRDVDGATALEGLATTGGLISSTGVGGFTLGGGAGWLMRKHGLACDNVRGAAVVLADGRFVRASAQEHADLFWGLRGGAGGLGVVTSFDFQLHPLREVLAGLVVHSAEHGVEALRTFRDFAAGAPDEFCGVAVIAHAPPLPFLDPAWHGRAVIMFAMCWSGDLAEGEAALAGLRSHGRPVVDHVGRMPYAQWQQIQDPLAPRGHYYYWKTANYGALSDHTVDDLAAMAFRLPTMRSEIHLQHMGGAVSRFAAEDSAFAHRNTRFFVNFIGITDAASAAGSLREGIRALHDQASPEALPGILTNFADQDDSDNIRRFGSQNAGRLEALRKKYDPTGIFQGA